jgi:formyl-CoA transferase
MTTNSASAGGALAGVRVIDLTRVLGGPYCTQILGDHGADIIKVEPPQGDEVRDWGPPFRDGTASYFIGVNRNKRALALDLSREAGRAVLLRLLEKADVLIHNFKVGTLEKWGIGYEAALKPHFPRLIYCHLTGFGPDGPLGGLPGYDAAVQAVSGLMSINGYPDGPATRIGTPVVDLAMGLYAAIGINMALYEREKSGQGQAIDVSLYDSAIALLHPQAANFLMSGKPPARIGNAHPNIAPYDSFETGGKPIFLAVGNNRQFERLCVELGAPELAKDRRFLNNSDRVANRDALRAELETLLRRHDGATLADRLIRIGVPCGAVLDVPEMFAHPHTKHRNMLLERGVYKGFGIPAKMARTPGGLRHTPPQFNEHGDAILAEAGYTAAEISALKQNGALHVERKKGGGEG